MVCQLWRCAAAGRAVNADAAARDGRGRAQESGTILMLRGVYSKEYPVNLLQSLQHEIDEMLAQEQIYEALDYAWEDENTPSDSYTGLAMWLQDVPFQLDEDLWHRKSAPPNPTARDEFFLNCREYLT